MKKLVKNLLIGIIIAIVGSLLVTKFSKSSAERNFNSYLQNQQKDYDIVLTQNKSRKIGSNFSHNNPYFSIDLPIDLELIKAIDSNGITGYIGEIDTIMCQLQIIDTYNFMDTKAKNTMRKMYDYNMYSRETMNAAYNGLVKSTIDNSPYGEVTNVFHSIQKINDVIFVYIEYEIPDEEDSIIRKSYNFLINGYSILVAGMYFQSDINAGKEVDNYLKSIKFI